MFITIMHMHVYIVACNSCIVYSNIIRMYVCTSTCTYTCDYLFLFTSISHCVRSFHSMHFYGNKMSSQHLIVFLMEWLNHILVILHVLKQFVDHVQLLIVPDLEGTVPCNAQCLLLFLHPFFLLLDFLALLLIFVPSNSLFLLVCSSSHLF